MARINQEEYEILKPKLEEEYTHVGKSRDGKLQFLQEYVERDMKREEWSDGWGQTYMRPVNLFQFIKWFDSEPYNITELIEEYEYSAEHVSYVVNERVKALGKAWSESEGTEVKNVSDVIEKVERNINVEGRPDNEKALMRLIINDLEKLDEPEITLDKAFEKVAESYSMTKEEVWRHLEQFEAHGGKVTHDEPETVADVLADFIRSGERLKKCLSMEVEELEE